MTNESIDALNDITEMLIDSRKGYEKAAEVTDDNYAFKTEFQRRAQDRAALVTEFQNRVRTIGGEPRNNGGVLGSLHRASLEFSSLFRDNEKAALDAIDDGEEQLAETIESKLEREELDAETRALLQKAHTAAKQGECFAERLERQA